MVIAVNKKGKKQEFSDLAWKMLGKADKDGWRDGWREATAQPVQNSIKKPLPTGEAAKPAAPPAAQKVENVIDPAGETGKGEPVSHDSGIPDAPPAATSNKPQAEKDDFIEAIDGLAAPAIKNFLDTKNIEYSKKDKLADLQIKLGEYLNYDIKRFQTEFTA